MRYYEIALFENEDYSLHNLIALHHLKEGRFLSDENGAKYVLNPTPLQFNNIFKQGAVFVIEKDGNVVCGARGREYIEHASILEKFGFEMKDEEARGFISENGQCTVEGWAENKKHAKEKFTEFYKQAFEIVQNNPVLRRIATSYQLKILSFETGEPLMTL